MITMKKIITLAFIACSFAFYSCEDIVDELDKFTEFELAFTEEFTYPAAPLFADSIRFDGPPTSTNSDSTFKTNNTQRELVEKVEVKNLDLVITAPDSGNFQFMDYIRVFIMADLNGDGFITDETERIEVANKLVIPSTIGKELILDPIPGDFKLFVFSEEISLSLQYGTNKPTTFPLDIDVNVEFTVNAKVLGV